MGLHYSQRTYYDDPKENADFIKYYGSLLYCSHHQPGYVDCWKCREECYQKHQKPKDRFNDDFWNFFRNMFEEKEDYEEDLKDTEVENSKLPTEFNKLKKSKSFEELRKEYYKLSKIYHPDKPTGNTSIQQRLNNLYERLVSRFI